MKYEVKVTMALATLLALAVPCAAKASPQREVLEQLVRRGAGSADELAPRLRRLRQVHGDEALDAIRHGGPSGLVAIERAGTHADEAVAVLARHGEDGLRVASDPRALDLVARHGDDAAAAMVRHPGVADDVIAQHGHAGATAIAGLSSRNARRLAMLSEEGALGAAGQGDEVLEVLVRRGDAAMEFIWRHKGVLAGGAALAAFLSDPDPYIDGVKELAEVAVGPGEVLAEGVAGRMNWTLLGVLALVSVLGLGAAAWATGNRRFLALRCALPDGVNIPEAPTSHQSGAASPPSGHLGGELRRNAEL